jgi:hypothetical protein
MAFRPVERGDQLATTPNGDGAFVAQPVPLGISGRKLIRNPGVRPIDFSLASQTYSG